MSAELNPLSPVKAAVILEAGGWEASGAVFARGQEVAVVVEGTLRIVPAARWADFLAPAKWGTLGTVAAPAPGEESEEDGIEYFADDENEEAWRAEMAGLCNCENPVCSSVLEGGVCRSEI